ncbi:hypothetical protein EI94DRAFT_1729347 [Lactarius quietus]|nr:hypothetical protein EI94DRAFT_1729347 [Lactarius quietus]
MSAAVAHRPSADIPSQKRKRCVSLSVPRQCTSPEPPRSLSPPPPRGVVDVPRVEDVDPVRRAERERQLAARMAAVELGKVEDKKGGAKEKEFDAVAEFAKLTSSRSGGVYMPPARLRALQAAAAEDRSSPEYQRLSWDALRKSITGIVNRVNVSNIKHVVPEILSENLIRGRGLFARSIMKAQAPACHLHQYNWPQILVLLLERPTDDSIEIAVGFTREAGAFLQENSPKANATVFERFRAVLNEGNISHRVQYMIEVLMQVRKDKYKDNPVLPEGLDLFDPNFLDNEEKYKEIKAEILGEGSSDEESGSESDSEDDEAVPEKEGIEDRTETNLVNLRRVIYLTIMNALNYEEAVHKLLKVQLKEGEEIELVNMVIECCSQERSYSTFYGLTSERFCKLNRTYYDTIHRYETNRLRNIARLFGHLLANDAMSWGVLHAIKMNEDDTTSSSRIFVKIMMQEVTESMGLPTLKERFADPEIKAICNGMFPLDNPKNTRFAINYFTSVGLGALTEEMREHLKNAPRLIMEQRRAMLEAESSSSDSSSDTDSSSDITSSDPDSDAGSDSTDGPRNRRRRSPSPPRRPQRDSPRRRRDDSRSASPPPRPRRDESRRGRDDSRTPSPPPSRRNDDRKDDRRGNYGRDRRRSVSDSGSPSVGATTARVNVRRRHGRGADRDRDRDYDRRRDDSRDRYRDRRR